MFGWEDGNRREIFELKKSEEGVGPTLPNTLKVLMGKFTQIGLKPIIIHRQIIRYSNPRIVHEILEGELKLQTHTISGNLVSCSTLVTATPALSNAEAVPPVETIEYLQFNRVTAINWL